MHVNCENAVRIFKKAEKKDQHRVPTLPFLSDCQMS